MNMCSVGDDAVFLLVAMTVSYYLEYKASFLILLLIKNRLIFGSLGINMKMVIRVLIANSNDSCK
jgi:hypothetical protein